MGRFRRKKETTDLDRQMKEQTEASDATLEYVKAVLQRKDELLAEAINQTGRAVRRGDAARRGRPV